MQLKCDINETKILKFVLLRNHHHLQKRKDACQRKRKKKHQPQKQAIWYKQGPNKWPHIIRWNHKLLSGAFDSCGFSDLMIIEGSVLLCRRHSKASSRDWKMDPNHHRKIVKWKKKWNISLVREWKIIIFAWQKMREVDNRTGRGPF